MIIQLPLHVRLMQTYCIATWTMGSSMCGLWQGVCTYLQDWLSPFRTNTQRAPYVQHSPNKYDDEEGEVIEKVIGCSWMSGNNWVIYTHINLNP